ncbi:conserved hypothetical protein [Micromonospora sp. ATCC 39149]|uniref:SH3 domain-containing protein n=1 Tax=Micromonospora carbonacea TaxID=47853 RepID=A0A7D6C643_9ACTN|nr:hypothetical protein [Micromonospora sp. ATCC 39149]EEP72773.1 conserved hypothetical protein [Micromonospora sp. ATCC 39149]QLJ98864.1 hypothetical protein HZU44_01195 [Micromonospora carbonacea]
MSRATTRALVASAFAVVAVSGALLTGVTTASAAESSTSASITLDCSSQVTANVNLHLRPDPSSPIGGQLEAGAIVTVVRTTIGVDGKLWLELNNGMYVQASLTTDLDCDLDY